MSSEFPSRNLNQTAVYWGSPVADGHGGYTFATPVEISCRWGASTKMIMSSTGAEKLINAEVQVDQDLDEEGMLYLGELTDISTLLRTKPLEAGASQILRFDKIPTLRGDKFFRKAYL